MSLSCLWAIGKLENCFAVANSLKIDACLLLQCMKNGVNIEKKTLKMQVCIDTMYFTVAYWEILNLR